MAVVGDRPAARSERRSTERSFASGVGAGELAFGAVARGHAGLAVPSEDRTDVPLGALR